MTTPTQNRWNLIVAELAVAKDNLNHDGTVNWDFVEADCHMDYDVPPTAEEFNTAVGAYRAGEAGA